MITIEKIEESDLLCLGELLEELIGVESNHEHMKIIYKKISNDNHYFLMGAQEDNNLIGTLMGIVCYDLVGDCRPFMVLENLIISPKHRSKGVARSLFKALEDIAEINDCYYIIFVSGDNRKKAHGLYESLEYSKEPVKGFRKILG